MTALLAVEKIEVVYKRVITAVQGVTLTVGERQIVALLGTNGAGKTTTLRAISGFLGLDDARVTEGSVMFDGTRLENRPPHEIAARGIVLVPEREKVFPNLTVAENLIAPVSHGGGDARRQEERVYHFFPRLAELRARVGGLLSGGERQMLAIASALMCQPKILLIDELSLGLAPIVVDDLKRRLTAIRDELSISILLVEQSAAVALEIADHAYVMENGRVVLDGNRERLQGHKDVQEFYLGGADGTRRSYRDVKQYRRSRRWYG
ncbi:MAG: ABC transporter ATP-binding protein [Xanthobacteraceae bacterium]|uniref:ABC transporter ATP-binding protein n=1 Tax=Pseudolabrys sp. TaxID=1960880 RepID=UPI003D10229A